MRKILTRLIALFLLLMMVTGVALASAPGYPSPPPFPGAFVHVEEGYYTEDGVYVPPGYYFSDGSYVPEEGDEENEPSRPP